VPTQHLRVRQRDDQSLPLLGITTQVAKRCVLSGQTVQAAGPVTSLCAPPGLKAGEGGAPPQSQDEQNKH